MDKTFLPSYSPSQITCVEAEGFSRFRRKRTASASLVRTSLYFYKMGASFKKSWEPVQYMLTAESNKHKKYGAVKTGSISFEQRSQFESAIVTLSKQL